MSDRGDARRTRFEPRTLTHDELLSEAKARFGDDPRGWAFTCPSCGDTATAADFTAAAADVALAGLECIGRSLGALTEKPWIGRGCTFVAYGLIPGPWTIVMPDGKDLRAFPLAEVPEQVTSGG